VVDRRPADLRHPAVRAAAALLLAVLTSTVLSGANGSAGVVVALRYLSYLAVTVVILDTVRRGLPARRVMAVFTVSCAAAGIAGLVGFLAAGGGRAAGPLEDANDFAFFLIAALPFSIVLAGFGGRARLLWGAAGVVLAVSALATFSRGGLLGMAAIAAVGVLVGALRVRVLAVAATVVVLTALTIAVVAPQVVERSLAEKEHVAGSNVTSRFASWTIAAEMTADRPVLGHGPGAYRTEALRYVPPGTADTTHLDVAHQMYLDVASELGLVGLGAFLAMIGAGIAGAWRAVRSAAAPTARGSAALATGVLMSLAGCLVAASFLSEQYYLPVWLLVALGAALDPVPQAGD
jgi:O-antigen ligase